MMISYRGKIDALSFKGEGLGDFEVAGEVKQLKVPFTIVGEEVEVCWLRKKRAFPLKILSPAPSRIEPRCMHFGVCGGCSYQHIDYSHQAKFKEEQFKRLFDSDAILPLIEAKNSFSYRNKMELTFSMDREKRRFLGLIAKDSGGKIFSLRECPISDAPVVKAKMAAMRFWEKSDLLAYHRYRDEGSLENLLVRKAKDQVMCGLIVSGNPSYALNRGHMRQFVAEMKKEFDDPSLFLLIQQRIKGKPTQFFEIHLSGPDHLEEEITLFGKKLLFQVSPRSFFQPNTLMAEMIYQRALELLDLNVGEVVYDLFCGAGTLSLCASLHASQVIGIDLSYEAIVDAKENLKHNEIENVTFYQGDVGEVLREKADALPQADSVVVDPPRVGLTPKQIEEIIKLKPKKIIYISCNPKSLAENLLIFEERGYHLISLQPIDQFAQTPHLEAVAKLVQK